MGIKALVNNKSDIEFDIFEYQAIAKKSDIYKDVINGKIYSVPLICAGLNGVYVFITTHQKSNKALIAMYRDVARIFDFTSGVYVFIRTEEKDYFIFNGEPVEIEYMLDKYENLYNNNLRPQTELAYFSFKDDLDLMNRPILPENMEGYKGNKDGYVTPRVSAAYLKTLKRAIEKHQEEHKKAEKYIYKNDMKYVRHPITKFGMIVDEAYFPVSNEDPWKFMLLILLGGIFGLHKFKTHEFLKGFGYMLTCGCFVAGYLVDIVAVLTGTYSVTQVMYYENNNHYSNEKIRIYVDELDKKHKLIGLLFIPLGLCFAYAAFKMLYQPLLSHLFEYLSTL